MASCPSAARRSHPRSRTAHGQFGLARGRTGARLDLPDLSSRPQSRQVVKLQASRILLGLLVRAFAPTGPLVLGIDETIERRRSHKIAATGIYRDPVRSSHSHFVKVTGLRWVCLWVCLLLLVPIPWAGHVWALPFLTALAPSER